MHYWTLEATILLLGIVTAGDPTHFTWWGVGILAAGVITVGVAGGTHPYARRVIVTAVVSSVLIQGAVLIMSIMRCGMLNATYNELGPWVYAFGNFVLHYYPALRALHWAGRYLWPAPFEPLRGWQHKLAGFHGDTALVISAYCILVQPAHVYGCAIHSPGWLSIVGCTFALLLEMAVLVIKN